MSDRIFAPVLESAERCIDSERMSHLLRGDLLSRAKYTWSAVGAQAEYRGVRRALGVDEPAQATIDWVKANGQPVDPALWRVSRPRAPTGDDAGRGRGGRGPAGAMQLYDMRPEAGVLVAAE